MLSEVYPNAILELQSRLNPCFYGTCSLRAAREERLAQGLPTVLILVFMEHAL